MAAFEEKQDDTPQEKRWPATLLNENHRRSLAAVLRRVELAVWRLEDRLIRGTPQQLTLTRFTSPPDRDQQAALLHLTKHVRQEIAKLAFDYDLEVAEENLLRSIRGEFTLLWCDVEDIRPQKLGRYGAINPQAYEALGPPIQQLIDLMLAIDGVASGKQEMIRAWQAASESSPEG
jgi:hypothetical protein